MVFVKQDVKSVRRDVPILGGVLVDEEGNGLKQTHLGLMIREGVQLLEAVCPAP